VLGLTLSYGWFCLEYVQGFCLLLDAKIAAFCVTYVFPYLERFVVVVLYGHMLIM